MRVATWEGRRWDHAKTTEHEGYEATGAGPANEVKVLAWEGCRSEVFATSDFFHEVTEDEERGKASYASAVEGEDSCTGGGGSSSVCRIGGITLHCLESNSKC